ncbi:hypothetical protein SDC9_187720 [bioreactor metagenome]|uniref:Uncharacterized protein n=1 Tax=bioreactor metagenome TaxID=1076179 RepID=A0A645HVJ0_9ZZZZ
MLARGAGAEIGAGHQHGRLLVSRLVEQELGVLAPGCEQPVFEAGAGDALQVDSRNDLIGVDIAAAQRDGDTGVRTELVHGVRLLTDRPGS